MPSNSANEKYVDHQRLRRAWEAYQAADYATALTEYSVLAEKGHPHAWIYLGLLHKQGFGVPQDYSKAQLCFNHAIALGDVFALVKLGRLYNEKVNGAAEKAFDCFLNAANKGNLSGIYWTGRAYLRGRGTKKNIEKAREYLTTAIGRGHVYARMEYCAAQSKGIYGPGQIIAGLFGVFKTIVVMIKILRSDPHGERLLI